MVVLVVVFVVLVVVVLVVVVVVEVVVVVVITSGTSLPETPISVTSCPKQNKQKQTCGALVPSPRRDAPVLVTEPGI